MSEPSSDPFPIVSPYRPVEDDNKLRECEAMRETADRNTEYTRRCINGEKVFYVEDTRARIPGHIYSVSGVREYGISGCCEFHFDEMFPAEEEDGDE